MSLRILKCTAVLLLALILNTAYVASFSSPTVAYMSNVLLHLVLGIALSAAALWLIFKGALVRETPLAVFLFLSAAVVGLLLTVRGNITENRWILFAHIVVAGASLVAFLPFAWRQPKFSRFYSAALIVLVILPTSTATYRRLHPAAGQRIKNPTLVPISMHDEGGGPHSPFFPS